MQKRSGMSGSPLLALALLGAAGLFGLMPAQEGPDWNQGLPRQHRSKWLVHDANRPEPPVVKPGVTANRPPADAVVLFDGQDLSAWESAKPEGGPAGWKVESGHAEVNATGSIRTRAKFGDCQLHLEWRAPAPPQGRSQVRGNSGIFFMSRYEVQILDSHGNKTYADGHAAGVYGQHPPLANACRPPGEWQTYDIVFRAPRWKDGKVAEPARLTIFHNGVLTAHNAEVYGETVWRQLAEYRIHGPEEPLLLQDHGDKQAVRFRNIWIRRLDLSGVE